MNLKPFISAFALTASICLGISTSVYAENSSQTMDFVHKASEGNMFEIESSKLALIKTSAKDVKSFAEMMVTDHTQVGDQFKKALAASGSGLAPADKLDSDHQETFNSLKAAAPAVFDSLYIQAQGKAHDDAVSLFASYAENGDDAALKKFASDELPVLKKHQGKVHALSTYTSSRQ